MLTTGGRIEVLGVKSSGEVEYALLVHNGQIYVTVASDHTDREFEPHGIQAWKQLCPEVIATTVWPYAECQDHWERHVLRCWTTCGGRRQLYQEAELSELLSAEEWMGRLDAAGLLGDGLVFLSGPPATNGGVVSADAYEIVLEEPVLRRSIGHRYEVSVLGRGYQ